MRYSLHSSLLDLALIALPRILSLVICLAISYRRKLDYTQITRQHPYSLNHENGDRKSKAELEEELLEGKPFACAELFARLVSLTPFTSPIPTHPKRTILSQNWSLCISKFLCVRSPGVSHVDSTSRQVSGTPKLRDWDIEWHCPVASHVLGGPGHLRHMGFD